MTVHYCHDLPLSSPPSLPSARESGMISAMQAVFVGRHHELVELRAGLEDAATGRGRFFLVVGEAGIGKTRLVEELAREAAERGHLVVWGRCWEGEGAPPYWPWIQVIRACLPRVADAAGAPYLAQLVPELGGLQAPAPPVAAVGARALLPLRCGGDVSPESSRPH